MEFIKPTVFYYPTTTLFLDDDENFLASIALNLPAEFNYELNSKPEDVIRRIIAQKNLDTGFIEQLDATDLAELTEFAFSLKIENIKNRIYDPTRFSHVSVVVIDQLMPSIDGIEVCKRLAGTPVKKIMLTGETENDLVIDAFNKGFIDYFIAKDDPNLFLHLQAAIKNLQSSYFQSLSIPISTATKLCQDSFLNEAQFTELFNAYVSKNQLVEFYLLDVVGSYLGLDKSGKQFFFLIKNESQMEDLWDIVESADIESELLSEIRERKKLIYFVDESQQNEDIESWTNLMNDVNTVLGGYYITYVSNNLIQTKQESTIKSLNEYLGLCMKKDNNK